MQGKHLILLLMMLFFITGCFSNENANSTSRALTEGIVGNVAGEQVGGLAGAILGSSQEDALRKEVYELQKSGQYEEAIEMRLAIYKASVGRVGSVHPRAADDLKYVTRLMYFIDDHAGPVRPADILIHYYSEELKQEARDERVDRISKKSPFDSSHRDLADVYLIRAYLGLDIWRFDFASDSLQEAHTHLSEYQKRIADLDSLQQDIYRFGIESRYYFAESVVALSQGNIEQAQRSANIVLEKSMRYEEIVNSDAPPSYFLDAQYRLSPSIYYHGLQAMIDDMKKDKASAEQHWQIVQSDPLFQHPEYSFRMTYLYKQSQIFDNEAHPYVCSGFSGDISDSENITERTYNLPKAKPIVIKLLTCGWQSEGNLLVRLRTPSGQIHDQQAPIRYYGDVLGAGTELLFSNESEVGNYVLEFIGDNSQVVKYMLSIEK